MNRVTSVSWQGQLWTPFVQGKTSTDGAELKLSYEGRNSIDWPLRLKRSSTIFFDTDWMLRKYPIGWQSLALAVMTLATNHVFITHTKDWRQLFAMLSQINDIEDRAIPVPADITFVRAIERANRQAGLFNLSRKVRIVADPDRAKSPAVTTKKALTYATLPWLPRNVFFGITINTVREAETAVFVLTQVRGIFPEIRLVTIQDPALEVVDWEKLGLEHGVVDWMVWSGGERDGWDLLRDFGRKTGTRVYINEATVPAEWVPIQESVDLTGVLV